MNTSLLNIICPISFQEYELNNKLLSFLDNIYPHLPFSKASALLGPGVHACVFFECIDWIRSMVQQFAGAGSRSVGVVYYEVIHMFVDILRVCTNYLRISYSNLCKSDIEYNLTLYKSRHFLHNLQKLDFFSALKYFSQQKLKFVQQKYLKRI